uniref:Uncharacterized protein n=1 Tax=Escherichia coli TaxID=562 RepID=A0A6D1NYH8_ECOLX|nr:hypothetical protein [Escherichia coli]QIQ13081.1 Hypothetical protein [Salmonella enterica]QQP62319.1 hypothetical protein [Escherichia coli]QQP62678.1 hypothetical protein [Escherichia coli]UMW97613.1 hypothetical protein [Escherichia coli]
MFQHEGKACHSSPVSYEPPDLYYLALEVRNKNSSRRS